MSNDDSSTQKPHDSPPSNASNNQLSQHGMGPARHQCRFIIITENGEVQCPQTATEEVNLGEHVERMHLGVYFTCTICQAIILRHSALNRHLRIHNETRDGRPIDPKEPPLRYFIESAWIVQADSRPPEGWVQPMTHTQRLAERDQKKQEKEERRLAQLARHHARAQPPTAGAFPPTSTSTVGGTSVSSTSYFNEVNQSTSQSLQTQTPGASSSRVTIPDTADNHPGNSVFNYGISDRIQSQQTLELDGPSRLSSLPAPARRQASSRLRYQPYSPIQIPTLPQIPVLDSLPLSREFAEDHQAGPSTNRNRPVQQQPARQDVPVFQQHPSPFPAQQTMQARSYSGLVQQMPGSSLFSNTMPAASLVSHPLSEPPVSNLNSTMNGVSDSIRTPSSREHYDASHISQFEDIWGFPDVTPAGPSNSRWTHRYAASRDQFEFLPNSLDWFPSAVNVQDPLPTHTASSSSTSYSWDHPSLIPNGVENSGNSLAVLDGQFQPQEMSHHPIESSTDDEALFQMVVGLMEGSTGQEQQPISDEEFNDLFSQI